MQIIKERELIWLMKIVICDYRKKMFSSTSGGTKADFERVVDIRPKNKDFRSFLNDLIERGELEFFEDREGGGKRFIVDVGKIMKRIKKDPLASKYYKICCDDYFSLKL